MKFRNPTPIQQAEREGFLRGIALAVEVLVNVTCALALYALVRPLHPLPGEDDPAPDELEDPRISRETARAVLHGYEVPAQREGSDDL